jgi:hypothetical protein
MRQPWMPLSNGLSEILSDGHSIFHITLIEKILQDQH